VELAAWPGHRGASVEVQGRLSGAVESPARQAVEWADLARPCVGSATSFHARQGGRVGGGVLPREYDQMLNFPPSSVCTLFIWAEPTHHASSPGWASAGLRI